MFGENVSFMMLFVYISLTVTLVFAYLFYLSRVNAIPEGFQSHKFGKELLSCRGCSFTASPSDGFINTRHIIPNRLSCYYFDIQYVG